MINKYFEKKFSRELPRRVFARSVDYEPHAYEHFDAVDADWIERQAILTPGIFDPETYGRLVQEAPIYSIEVYAEQLESSEQKKFDEPWAFAADAWLDDREIRGDWLELTLNEDRSGPAVVYASAEGAGQRAALESRDVSSPMSDMLTRAVDLRRFQATNDEIERALPTADVAGVVVLDVGQGAANAIIDTMGKVIAYFDIGAGITRDAKTWPASMKGFCLAHKPPIILSHWHQDHFHGANKFPRSRGMTWIAPIQNIGAGPQSAMANAIQSDPNGRLLTWSGNGPLRRGRLQIERCTGSQRNMNRSGIALWIEGPRDAPSTRQGDILLPGDASYGDVPGLAATSPRPVHSFAVAHHGGAASGRPPMRQPQARNPRAALSYGPANSYGHPLHRSLVGLRTMNWSFAPQCPRIDDPRTEDRTRGARRALLGHIGLDWGLQRLSVSCTCGASVQPHQF